MMQIISAPVAKCMGFQFISLELVIVTCCYYGSLFLPQNKTF